MTPFQKVLEFFIADISAVKDEVEIRNRVALAGVTVAAIFDHVPASPSEISFIEKMTHGSLANHKDRCVTALKSFRKFEENTPLTETAEKTTKGFIEYACKKMLDFDTWAKVLDPHSATAIMSAKSALLAMHEFHQRDPSYNDRSQRQNFNRYVDALLSKELPPVSEFRRVE